MEQSENLLTVQQFCDIAGITPQAAYKSISLQPFTTLINGKKFIDKAALAELYPDKAQESLTTLNNGLNGENADNTQPLLNGSTTVEQPFNNRLQTELIETMRQELAAKDSQLAAKDKQIEELHKLLSQAQQLQLHTQAQYQQLLESTQAAEQEQTEESAAAEPPKKKSIFSFFKKQK